MRLFLYFHEALDAAHAHGLLRLTPGIGMAAARVSARCVRVLDETPDLVARVRDVLNDPEGVTDLGSKLKAAILVEPSSLTRTVTSDLRPAAPVLV